MHEDKNDIFESIDTEDFDNKTEEECLELVRKKWIEFNIHKNQTEEICLEAVRQNCNAIKCVQNQTEKICIEAVKQD